MKAVGIVVEYNPFHNGHLYHLQQTKVKSGADIVIAIMSGSFLQRGEPALVSKHARTKMALRAGIDLVIELPYAFSTQKAETFARGAVLLLDALQASEVCFGSEAGDITPFEQLIDFLRDREAEFNEQLKHFLQEGCSYPKANALAFSSLNPNKTMLDLSLPNNILGY
ncbi:MAG TPA: nucleotidyltransferase, partial [Bacilli bacterium]|nr:nucleotidyltransferase [Bacilli bacterium]